MGSKMVKCKQTQERKSPIQLKLNETTKQRMDGWTDNWGWRWHGDKT